MNSLASLMFEVMDLLAPDTTEREEVEHLAEVLGSRTEAAAYCLLRHEAISSQPGVVAELAKLGALGLGLRSEYSRSTVHAASPAEIDKAKEDLRGALKNLLDHDRKSSWAGDAVAERRRVIETFSPSRSPNGFADRVRR